LNEAKTAFSKRSRCDEQHGTEAVDTTALSVDVDTNAVPKKSVETDFTASSDAKCQRGKQFESKNISELLVIEIFAGTARLSKTAREAGFQVLPIDKSSSRATQIFVASYDVTVPEQLDALKELLETEAQRILAVHLAPACGTASRAREKKLKSFAKRGFKIPGPLRSTEKPLGLDGLQGLDKIRTESANLVYSATAVLVRKCLELNILCSLENPANSLFWFFPEISELLDLGFKVSFHNCMHGGNRNKLTTWWSTKDVFSELAVLCDAGHTHAKWNPTPVGNSLSFPTAEEAAYPFLLCKRLVAILVQHAIELGAENPIDMEEQLPSGHVTSHRWVIDMLPKGKLVKPLVSEFQSYKNFIIDVASDPEQSQVFKTLPKGARIVHRQLQWGTIRVDEGLYTWVTNNKSYEIEAQSPLLDKIQLGETMQAELIAVGMPRDPWDFLARAVEAGHPRSLAVHLNDGVQNMLRENFSEEPHKVVKARVQFLKTWTARCKELEQAERDLHDSLEPHLRNVLEGKRLLLFKEILISLQYPDTELVDTICQGFPLTGWMPKSHVFPPHMKRPTHSLDAAKRLAKGVNHSIIKQVSEQSDPELAAEVWNQSLDEVSKGWTWFDDDGGTEGKILAKRFGLKQGDKIRMIDDCSVGGFNASCGTSEKFRVHAVDELAAYMCWCMTNLGREAMQQVVGKTYDLKNAYKQYGVRAQDRDLLRIAVWDHEQGRVRLMGTNALPLELSGPWARFCASQWLSGTLEW